MPTIRVSEPVKSAELLGRVVRCGCSPDQKVSVQWHGYHNRPCPRPRAFEDLGTIAYWHCNPLKRWWRNWLMRR